MDNSTIQQSRGQARQNFNGASKTIRHIFRSGNDLVLRLPASIARSEATQVIVEWERFPPSQADIAEYKRLVYPKILGACRKALEPKVPDDHRFVEIMPGITILVGKECVA